MKEPPPAAAALTGRLARRLGGLRPPAPPKEHAAPAAAAPPPCTGRLYRTAAHLTAGPPYCCGAHRCGLLARMARAGAREPYRPPPYPAAMGPKAP